MGLRRYQEKRRFGVTSEPRGATHRKRRSRRPVYVIQKHDARRLHYDLRLELDGVLKSWAVPKGPSLDPAEKRLAVEVEDHPLEYGGFEGRIPEGEYGAGQVVVWDRGTWEPVEDPHDGLRRGRLEFVLHGEKLRGAWMLVRMGGRRAANEPRIHWLLIKERDEFVRPRGRGDELLEQRPESVISGRTLERDRREGRDGRRDHRRSRRRAVDPATIAGARKAGLPRTAVPQLATLVRQPETGEGWLHEIKFDGYRMLARIAGGRATMLSRTGQDWTERFAPVAAALGGIRARQALIDGEVVVLEPDGTTSFQALQNALRRNRDLVYFAFDLLHLDGWDLTGARLEDRKRALHGLLGDAGAGPVRYSEHVEGQGDRFHAEACRRGLEGIVSKRRDAPYRPARTRAWLKVKCSRRQEFVIGGFTEPAGARSGLGALLVGVHDADGLRYAGRVGTGFDNETLAALQRRLAKLERPTAPFVNPPRGRTVHWVEPELVAEVAFTEWTSDGRLRHPSFQGLREDKPARAVRRELPAAKRLSVSSPRRRRAATEARPREGSPATKVARRSRVATGRIEVAGVTISHPDRVLYSDPGFTKLDVARYYEAIAEWMLPEIDERPLMLKRCPQGQAGPCFFQKHPGETLPAPPLVPVRIRERDKAETYLTVRDAAGLVTLVQFGMLELHVWGSRASRLEQPDRMVFDLDPGPEAEWPGVVSLARELRDRLEELGLASVAKTTGGKGLHVVVPLAPSADWDDVLEFSGAVARVCVAADPAHRTTRMAKAGREAKILIDTMRNGRGATWVAPYSTRARPGAPVSMPVTWDEVKPSLRPDGFTVEDAPRRLERRGDPWREVARARQKLTRAMARALGVARGAATGR